MLPLVPQVNGSTCSGVSHEVGNPMSYAALLLTQFEKLHTYGAGGRGRLTNHFHVVVSNR